MFGKTITATAAQTPRPRTRWEILYTNGDREIVHSYYRIVDEGVYWFYDGANWRAGATYPTVNIRRCQPIGVEADPATTPEPTR